MVYLRYLPLVTLAAALGLWAYAIYILFFYKCPSCRRHRMRNIDHGIFYDPNPGRCLYRCANCRAEFVLFKRRWVARTDWLDADDRGLFDKL